MVIRVASVPESHVYVRHLGAAGDDIVRLPDPIPADGRTVPGGWWPPLMLEPRWVREHITDFDVFHIHFGFDAVPQETLAHVVDTLRRHRTPLVYTVHDLRNPHHHDPAAHDAHLDVLVPAADELITLTPGAADVIARRWGRRPTVLAHPHVTEQSWFDRRRPPTPDDPFVIGVHAKSLRPNMDVFPVVDTLVDTVAELPNASLRVNVHDEIFDPTNHWYAPDAGRRLLGYAAHEHVRVDVHRYYSDHDLFSYLAALSVSVLPYRFGTHSGWLEACTDLGTQVIAPSCGYYAQQQPCHEYVFDETRFDPSTLVAAVRAAWRARTGPPATTWPARLVQREGLAAAHHALYARALNRP